MTSFNIGLQSYGAVLLLWIGLLTEGAKTPVEFLAWSLCAVFLFAIPLCVFKTDRRISFSKEYLFILFVCLSQLYSQDPSVSQFQTTQIIFFTLLWMSFKLQPNLLPKPSMLYGNLAFLGVFVVIKSTWQLQHHHWPDIYGFLPKNPIFNGVWMTMVGVALLARTLEPKAQTGMSLRAQRTGATMGFLLCLCAVLSPVRTVLISVFFGFAYLSKPYLSAKKMIVGLLGLLILIQSAHLLSEKRLRILELNNRSGIWTVAIKTIKDHPLIGLGVGNFEMAYQRYAFPVERDTIRFARTTEFAHNEILQSASDIGIPATILLVWGLAWVFLLDRKNSDSGTRAAKAALLVIVTAALNNIVWHSPLLLYMTILWCACLRKAANAERLPLDPSEPPTKTDLRPLAWCASFFLCLASLSWCALRTEWATHRQWERILRWNPNDSWACKYWADAQSNPAAALAGYRRSTEIAPKQLYFREAYGAALESTRSASNVSAASDQYRQALLLSPSRALDMLSLGRTLYLQGSWTNALEMFRRARQTEPNYWECDLWIARCLDKLGHPDQAAWTLRYLVDRRDEHLRWREVMKPYLTGSNEYQPAAYDQILLAYDQRVVTRELSDYERGSPR